MDGGELDRINHGRIKSSWFWVSDLEVRLYKVAGRAWKVCVVGINNGLDLQDRDILIQNGCTWFY